MKSKKMDKSIHKDGQTKKELLLLRPFIKEPWKQFTLREIKEISQNRSHHYVYEAMEKFIIKGIIKKEKRGNTGIYSLNADSKDASYLAFVEGIIKEERADLPEKAIEQVKDKMPSPYYILLIAGSYAEGKQKSSSDLDIAVIIPNNEAKKPYEIALKEGELTIPAIHGFVFRESEFYSMLIEKGYNFGKECSKKHIIIHGAEPYYEILFRAIQNGFKG